ncbi:uracil-DNA glycosylase family protein [Thiohalocapsa sp.]|uniref:uracil-DNA glycosylase family protein n=1 Tax=Thiohalocapsa sp. TaxID=2497641 RepID=UPI00345C2CD5
MRSPVLLMGQAPGRGEIERHRPFCWTAGKTLFGWFAEIGLAEAGFRASHRVARHTGKHGQCATEPGSRAHVEYRRPLFPR